MIVTGKLGAIEYHCIDVDQAETLSRLGLTPSQVEELKQQTRSEAARRLCAKHILAYYPEWKQLNLLRAGTKAQKDQMTAFIDACRAWSNGDNPDPAALTAIAP
jgi:hypothetical protein